MLRWIISVVAVAAIGATGTTFYYGYDEMEGLRHEAAHCGEPGCEQLAGTVRALRSELEGIQARDLPGKIASLEIEIKNLKTAVGAAVQERDRLSEQVAHCGEDGCAALKEKLAATQTTLAAVQADLAATQAELAATQSDLKTAGTELTLVRNALAEAQTELTTAKTELGDLKDRQVEIQQKLAMGQEENERLRTQLREEFARQAGRRITLTELLRIGPFGVGSFKLESGKLAEVEEALRPHKGKPLLVVGIADRRPFKGPSGELKQLGLMLARARVVKEMGYEVYYQVRQNDADVPDSRGVIVYELTIGSPSNANMAQTDTAPGLAIPTFYVSTQAQAG